MATQYILDGTFTTITEENGTIQNVGYEAAELVSTTNVAEGEGIELLPGEKRTFNGAMKARSKGAASTTVNVVDFKEGEGGGDDVMVGASASADGKSGLVPTPTAGNENRFLRGDGMWAVPTDEDTQYQPATTLTDGLMSAADKTFVEGEKEQYRQPSTAYTTGNIAYHASLPTGWYLECTTAGTTGSGELSITTTTPNTIITDDAVVWAIRQIVNIIASPSYYQREQLPTPAQTSVTINPTWLNIGGVGYTLKQSLILNLNSAENWDVDSYATAANRAGTDVYIYATATEDSITPGFVLSLNSTVPTGYSATNSRKIGGFHCLCADVGSISGHTLTGYVAGDILPQSVWDLSFRAVSENAGMVFVPGIGKWVDIYLPSWSNGGMASAYGGTIVDGSSTPAINGELAVEYFGLVGKELISRDEFIVAMAGSNQGTNINGSADPGTTGGHKDTANRRMISNYGIEDGCGALWQRGRDQYETFYNAGGNATTFKGAYYASADHYYLSDYSWQQKPVFNSNIESTAKGQCNGLLRRVLLGADWSNGANCGSRAAACGNFSAACSGGISARGVSSLRRTA